jgi:hypothetical protein
MGDLRWAADLEDALPEFLIADLLNIDIRC